MPSDRIVRDQANKTLDVYLQRIRKHGSSLPDTVLPPSNSDAAGAGVPRMGTPQGDSSWAGWAISSFTNKVASASGEMQSGANGIAAKAKAKANRPTSAPPSAETVRSSSTTASASSLHRQALGTPSATAVEPTAQNYFDDGPDDDGADAWAEMDEDSFFDAPTTAAQPAAAAPVAFDDGGEPDFAGWLNAQAQSKSKNPLPKGLAKKTSPAPEGRPGAANRSATTGSIEPAKKTATTVGAKPKPVAAKKVDTTPKDTGDEDDGWGDGW